MFDDIDLLFIDSGDAHTFALVSEEWSLYESALVDGAIVCMDDIRQNDMGIFWDALPYDKVEIPGISPFSFGVFQYRRKA